MIDLAAQWAIAVLGPGAVLLVGFREERIRRWGYIAGIAAQPFWFVTLYHNRQWPLFLVAAVYTVGWVQGIWNFWIRRGSRGTG